MKQKINMRLAMIALIAMIASVIGLTLVYYNLFRQQVQEDLRVHTELLNESGLFQEWYKQPEDERDPQIFGELKNRNLRITWIDANGDVLFDNDTDIASLTNHMDRPEILEAMEKGTGEIIRTSDTLHMNTFYYALRLDNGTILRVSTEARTITSVFLTAAPVMGLIVAVIFLVCIFLGHLLTAQLLRPINQMAEHLDDSVDFPIYKELEPFADKIRSQHENILLAAKSRQDFTANVSHELKTPLTAISGYAEILENRMVEPEHEIHIAQQIRQNSNRLLSVINDIIRLSELDHRELPSQFKTMDLGELAEECCRTMQVNAMQKQVSLTCSSSPVFLTGDRFLLKELLENLIQNAITYNQEGGTVRVTVTAENGHPVLSVKDDGIGIPKDQQDRIFERFYRVDKSRSRARGGTGLGLAIVKHIAELHSAGIRLDSEPGKGSEFTVTF